jgi:dTMP kinase
MSGKLIVFEGADNLGKTTQIEALHSYLAIEKKLKVIKTREPGATNLGSKIREILLNSKEKIPPIAQLMLFEADRNIHYETVLKPYLDKDYVILCDRFYLSTLVYQHKLNGTDETAAGCRPYCGYRRYRRCGQHGHLYFIKSRL